MSLASQVTEVCRTGVFTPDAHGCCHHIRRRSASRRLVAQSVELGVSTPRSWFLGVAILLFPMPVRVALAKALVVKP
ncbi:hypothetical protein NORO109296_03235 [Nocardiopsis rhodophaea]